MSFFALCAYGVHRTSPVLPEGAAEIFRDLGLDLRRLDFSFRKYDIWVS
jgi:hypothetical protein